MSSNIPTGREGEEAIPALLHRWSLALMNMLNLKRGQQNGWVKNKTMKEASPSSSSTAKIIYIHVYVFFPPKHRSF